VEKNKKTFSGDLAYWESAENSIKAYLEGKWLKVEMTDRTAITDFEIEDKNGTRYHIELKTRRNKKDKYATTMIGANKLEKAEKLFKEKGERTFFYFQFTDWLYYVDPLAQDYCDREVKRGRWDRGKFDKPKDYIYYDVTKLKKIY